MLFLNTFFIIHFPLSIIVGLIKRNMKKETTKEELLSPDELFERVPELRHKIRYNQHVGLLITLGLVRGRKVGRTCLVSLVDVCRIYKI